ncbi:MAG: hypothetical protein KAH44_15730, partial [Oricola sp.]|nr:hypothetical protein [Oricola sp.]
MAVAAARAEDHDGGPWRDMAESDLAFIRKTLDEKNIYAAYLPREEWTRLLERADAQVVEDLSKVTDPASYAGALERYVGVLQDPHAVVRFKFAPSNYRWPRLAAAYRGGEYRIVLSETPNAQAGDVVASCNGEPIAAIVEKIIKAGGDVEGPESSKASAARKIFVDDGSPFRPQLETCNIGGEEAALDWSRISSQALAVKLEDFTQFRDINVHADSFARNAVWVRMGVFGPGPEQAAQYHELIEAAPSWRNRKAIVFDVRGNGGGSYNWFMAVLRALYGDAYADYYARARTEITAVFADNSAYKTQSEREQEEVADPLNTPPDKLLDDAYAGGFEEMMSPGGATVYALKPDLPPLPEKVPAKLVKADVYVLTD